MSSKQLALNLVIDAKTGKLIGGLDKGGAAVDKFDGKVKKADKTTKKADQTVGQFAGAFKLLGGVVAGVSLGYFVTQLYEGIDAMQGMEAQLKTVTGSVGGAALEMDRLTNFAKATPFTINQSVEAFTKLTNLGLNPSEKAMMSYGNTAAAMGKDMMQMVEAVADAAVGEFERLKEFGIKAKNNGDSIAFTFQGQTTSIKNNAGDIEKYLQSIGENQFAGAMTDQMGRLSSKMSNAGIEAQLMAKSLGDAGLTAVFGGLIDSVSDIVSGTTEWITESGVLTEVMTETGATVADVLQAVYVIIKNVQLGWLYIGESATDAMAISADATADLINLALEPFLNIIGLIADGWGNIFTAVAEFTGSETLGAAAKSLNSFGESVKEFKVSGGDIVKLNQGMKKAVADTEKEISDLKKSSAGDKVRTWFKNNVVAINEQKKAAIDAAKATKDAASDSEASEIFNTKSMDDLIKKVDELGGSWKNTGELMTDAFGSIADQIEKMTGSFEMFNSLQEEFDERRKKFNNIKDLELRDKKLKELNIEENRMQEEQLKTTVGNFASIAGAASQMFDEQSKGREALHKIEQAFTVIEVALALKKAAANAMASIANQGNGDPYTAFARIAAMAALMAGLGLFSGSVSGSAPDVETRQKTQGTGSVFGSDDKSESINNALERMVDLETDQYAVLRTMNTSLRDLNNNITNLAVSLIGGYGKFDENSYGGELGSKSSTSKFQELLLGGGVGQIAKALDPTGIVSSIFSSFSKTKKSLVDSGITIVGQTLGEIIESGMVNAQAYYDVKTKKSSWWGLSSKTSYDREYESIDQGIQREFGLIFANVATSINEAVDILGLTVATEIKPPELTQDIINDIRADMGTGVDYKNLFKDYFNDITSSMGEEVERSLDNYQINLPNISFSDMSGEEIEAELQAIFSNQADLMVEYLVPGIAQFQQVGEGLYDTLVRVAQEQVVFNDKMTAIGLSLSRFGEMTKETETAIAQSLIELAGGIENYMNQTSTYFSEFFSDDEQFAHLTAMVTEQFASLETVMPSTRGEFRALVESLDLTTESGQQMFAALMSLVPAMDAYYDGLNDNTQALIDMTKDLQRELSSFDMTDIQLAIRDIEEWKRSAIEAAEEIGATDFTLIEKIAERKLANVLKTEVDSIEAEFKSIADNLEIEISGVEEKFKGLALAINATSNSIADSILNIKKGQSGFNASSYYGGKVSDLKSGLGQGTTEEQLDTINNINSAINERYQAELAAIQNQQSAAAAVHEQQMSAYQDQVSAIQTMNDAAKQLKAAAADLLVGGLSPLTAGEQLAEAEAQFKEMLNKARGGDVDAISALQQKGNQYLGLAQQFNPADYQDVFDLVFDSFNDIGNKRRSVPQAPEPHASTVRYQQAAEQLAADTIAELEELQKLTDELNKEAEAEMNASIGTLQEQLILNNEEMNASISALQEQFRIDSEKINATINEVVEIIPGETTQMLAAMEAQLNATQNMTTAIVTAIQAIPAPVVNVEQPANAVDPDVFQNMQDELQRMNSNLFDDRFKYLEKKRVY